jgi:hypothetical protein
VEIATKLAQANDLATLVKLQSEIARTLGVSMMTLYRAATSERSTYEKIRLKEAAPDQKSSA